MKHGLTPLLALVLLATPALARAQSELEPPPLPPTAPPAGAGATAGSPASLPAPMVVDAPALQPAAVAPHYDYFRLAAGSRVGFIDDPAFDAFASNDVLAQFSLEATYAFYTRGKLAVASGVAWDVGSRTAGARGVSTHLMVNRLTVPIEARYYIAPWLNAFAKVSPGAAAYTVSIEDPSSPATLQQAPWVFAADFSGGASVRLAGTDNHDVRRARLWLTTELGYGVTSSHALRPRPDRDESDVLGSDEATKLGSLALNGVSFRTGLAVSF